MTETMTILEKRLKKLETKVSTIKDNYEEMDNHIEDIYDTINNLKTLDSFENSSASNAKCDTNPYANPNPNSKSIDIDTILNTSTSRHISDDIAEMKSKCTLFYTRLLQNQPQLQDNCDSLKEHITYFIKQTEEQREIILDNLENVLTLTDKTTPRLFTILNSSLDTYHKKIALTKLHILETMQKTDSEYFKISQWLDTFLEIPFNTYKTPSYMNDDITKNPATYLTNSRQHLDTVIYGQDKTKQHIIEILARMIRHPKTLGSVFAIYGEAGTGKTTLIKEGLSQVFGLPFIFISLGGAQDRTTLAGSNYVYEGSNCGKIIQSLKQSQCMNPIFYFDELDKISETEKGNEIINLLIHLTDYTQNSHFMDDYMDGIAIDLSRATFVFSFNHKNKISPILLDRMEIIKFNSYTDTEKMVIAREFLLPNVVKNVFNDDRIKVDISDATMMKIICGYGCGGPSSGGPSPQDPLVPAGSFNRKKCNKKRLQLGKIMKKVSRRKKKCFQKRKGGVRYIKKILEKIVSRLNLQDLENPVRKQKQDLRNSARKQKQDLENPVRKQKQDLRNSARKNISNILTVDEKIVNEIINSSF
jgi:ATP-dependent Lon protease